MRTILFTAALLLSAPALAVAGEVSMCSESGDVRVEPAPGQRYLITFEGKRAEFHDIGGIGTGIMGRLYGDDEDRAVGVYWGAADSEIPEGQMMLVWAETEHYLKPCKS